MGEFLYRSPNQWEIEADFSLIPDPSAVRSYTNIKPMFVMAHHSGTFTHVGGPADTLFLHQKGFPTTGVSTSKNIKVAMAYASRRKIGSRFILEINRSLLQKYLIKEWDADLLGLRRDKPQDEEVILDGPSVFPKEIIRKIFHVMGNNELIEFNR